MFLKNAQNVVVACPEAAAGDQHAELHHRDLAAVLSGVRVQLLEQEESFRLVLLNYSHSITTSG